MESYMEPQANSFNKNNWNMIDRIRFCSTEWGFNDKYGQLHAVFVSVRCSTF